MFVIRNSEGEIVGAFANAQPDYAPEFLDEDNAELIAFFEKIKSFGERHES